MALMPPITHWELPYCFSGLESHHILIEKTSLSWVRQFSDVYLPNYKGWVSPKLWLVIVAMGLEIDSDRVFLLDEKIDSENSYLSNSFSSLLPAIIALDKFEGI